MKVVEAFIISTRIKKVQHVDLEAGDRQTKDSQSFISHPSIIDTR